MIRSVCFLFFFLIIGGSCELQRQSHSKASIAFVTNGVASFWTIAAKGVENAGEKFKVAVSVHMPAEGISDQKRIIQDLLTFGVDGIAISPIDPENQKDLIDEAARKSLIITQDSDAPGTNRLCYIGMDNYKAGRLCGQLLKEALPEGGEIMILVGRLEQNNSRRRRQGFIDEVLDRSYNPTRYDPPHQVLKNEKFSVVGTLTDQFDLAKAKANAEDAMARFPDLAAMVGLFAYNPPMILEAVRRTDRLGEIVIIAFDEDYQTLQAIQDGEIYGTIVQDPYRYGYESVRILAALVAGDYSVIPAEGFVDIPARQIRRNNVDDFWADLKLKLSKPKI